ncbi:IclR family transcriptional regulator C-terminal domain-containing protein [Lentzea sp. NPDC060358]|uniref:IclR family transcriptional regulator domain-containing protein n=1 Tax=Lentzea sp. NPDC060358 TaxID=3347103 RepID=UPI003663F8A6
MVHGADPDLLDTYDAERHPAGVRLLKFTDRLYRVAAGLSGVKAWLRDTAGPFLIGRMSAVPHARGRVVPQAPHDRRDHRAARSADGPRRPDPPRDAGRGTAGRPRAPGLACVASPVLGHDGAVVAAVSVAGPATRFDPRVHAAQVRAAARGIALTLIRRANLTAGN